MSKPPSPIDMIDSGADDNEPVKYVTHGHLRQWHDMMADMHNLIERLGEECRVWSNDYDDLGARLDAEITLADRYRSALEGIAANTCCENCQEAALVAHLALYPRADAENATPSEALPTGTECRPNSEFDSRDGGHEMPETKAIDLALESKRPPDGAPSLAGGHTSRTGIDVGGLKSD